MYGEASRSGEDGLPASRQASPTTWIFRLNHVAATLPLRPREGALYGKREHLERLRPYKVRPASEKIPDRWETGTQNHEGQAGVAAAIDYVAELGRRCGSPPASTRREQLLAAYKALRRAAGTRAALWSLWRERNPHFMRSEGP